MENKRGSKTTKLKSSDGAESPRKVHSRRRRSGSTSSSGPHASGSSDSPYALSKYLRDSKLDSPTASITPVKVEEDVIFKDEIPVPKSSKGGSEVFTKLTSNYSTYSGGRSSSTALPSAGGGAIANIKPEKNTPCRYWKTFGTCNSGSKCQFVHVEEELQRPPHSSAEGSAWLSYGKSYSQVTQSPSAAEQASSSPKLPAAMALSTAPAQDKHLSGSAVPSSTVPEAVHVEEELQRPSPSSGEVKQEGSAWPSYGKSYSQITQSQSAAEEASSSPSLPAAMALSTAPAQVKHLSGSAVPSSTVPEATQSGTDWSPLDDGIEINLPSTKNPSKEDVAAYIGEVLSGTKSKKRLSVFEGICRE